MIIFISLSDLKKKCLLHNFLAWNLQKKTKVYAVYTDPVSNETNKTVSLIVTYNSVSSITVEWCKSVKLYNHRSLKNKKISEYVNKLTSPAADLQLDGLYADNVLCSDTAYLVNPYITDIELQGEGRYLVKGKYFSIQQPKISVEYMKDGKAKYRRGLIDKTTYSFDEDTGDSQFEFDYPSLPNMQEEENGITGYFVLRNCVGIDTGTEDLDSDEIKELYLSGIDDASVREYSEIYKSLFAINQYNDELIWDDNKERVLVVTWTGAWCKDLKKGDTLTTSYGPVFVSPVPELQNFAEKLKFHFETKENIDLRTGQILGMNYQFIQSKSYFLEIWVKPSELFRPCPDPEITDQQAEMNFNYTNMVSLSVTDNYQNWYNYKWTNSYSEANKEDRWPFSGFGYTYDWGNQDNPVGVSEYVVRGAANGDNPYDMGTVTYIVNKVQTTEEYLAGDSD